MTPREQAQEGLNLLKRSILRVIRNHPDGISNADVARELDIRADYQGAHVGYLSWSILGLLLNEEKIEKSDRCYYPKDE